MEKNTTKEISLVDIFANLWNWIVEVSKKTVRFLGAILQLLYRRKILTLSILILTFIIGQFIARPSNRKYESEAMAYLYGVKSNTVMEVGSQLSKNSPLFDATSLSKKLNLPDTIAKKLLRVDFYKVVDYLDDGTPDVVDFKRTHSLKDTMNVYIDNFAYIRLTTLGTYHAEKLGKAVLDYLNNNAEIKSDFEAFRERETQRIMIAELEKQRIDSLARVKYFEDNKPNIKFDNNQVLVGSQETQLFYNDMLFLQDRKSDAESILAKAKNPVVLPSDFVINPKPINNRKKMALQYLLIGFLASIACAFTFENYKKWIEFLKK